MQIIEDKRTLAIDKTALFMAGMVFSDHIHNDSGEPPKSTPIHENVLVAAARLFGLAGDDHDVTLVSEKCVMIFERVCRVLEPIEPNNKNKE